MGCILFVFGKFFYIFVDFLFFSSHAPETLFCVVSEYLVAVLTLPQHLGLPQTSHLFVTPFLVQLSKQSRCKSAFSGANASRIFLWAVLSLFWVYFEFIITFFGSFRVYCWACLSCWRSTNMTHKVNNKLQINQQKFVLNLG